MVLSKDSLLKIRENEPWKVSGEDKRYYRDIIVIYIDLKYGGGQIIVNDYKSDFIPINTLIDDMKSILDLRKQNRCKNTYTNVVWVNSLHITRFFFKKEIELEEDVYNSKKGQQLWALYNKDFEIRNFNVISNVVNIEEIRNSCGFDYEIDEVEVMKQFLLLRMEQGLDSWKKLNYSFAYCANKLFFRGLEKELTYENQYSIPSSLNLYNLIQNSNKSGVLFYNSDYERVTIHDINSWDLSSAYPSQLVKQKMPMGHFGLVIGPPEHVFEKYQEAIDNDWAFIVKIEVKKPIEEINKFFGYDPIEEGDSLFYVFNDWDIKSIKLLGIKLRGLINELRICKKKEYLNDSFRGRVVEYYEEKQRTKKTNKKLYFEKKTTLDAIWGKGLQDFNPKSDEDIKKRYWRNPARYLLPQWSLWGAAATRYEMIKAIVGIIDISIEDFVACDTDGIKFLGDHNEYFKKRNEEIMAENAAAGFPNCEIGTWKYEGCFENFIQLKRKVYAYSLNGELTCKFAGCSKDAWREYFRGIEIEEAFERLSKEDFFIPASYEAGIAYGVVKGELVRAKRGYKPGDEVIGVNCFKAVQGM